MFIRTCLAMLVVAVYAWTYVLLKDKEWNPEVLEIPVIIEKEVTKVERVEVPAESEVTPVQHCFLTDDNYIICKLKD